MLKLNHLKIVALIAGLSLGACSHNRDRAHDRHDADATTTKRMNVNKDGDDREVAEYVEVKFDAGSDRLTADSKAAIENLIAKARRNGEIDEIKVLAWADQPYPTQEKRELSDSQQKLAANRAEAVEDYIDSFKFSVDVDRYNMANRPGVLARVFNTSDARFKKSLVAAGLPATADNPKIPNKASRAIVMALID